MATVLTAGNAPLLRPMAGLCLWTFTMEAWMYATRMPAMAKYNINLSPESTKEDMNSKIPRSTQWKADNYNHLHEQPTLFYAVVLGLTVIGDKSPVSERLAWSYVGLRVAHSLVQALTNRIPIRFSLFALSSIVLASMTGRFAQFIL